MDFLKWRYLFLFSSLLLTDAFGGWSDDLQGWLATCYVARVNSYKSNEITMALQAMLTGNLWLSPLLVFRLLGDSSVGRVEELAEFSVAVFQFLPFPAATSDLNIKDDIPYYSSNVMLEHPNSS